MSMTYSEAISAAQSAANQDGYYRIVVGSDESGFEVMEQGNGVDPDGDKVFEEDKCIKCGRTASEVKLQYHEESGDGWDHTDGGEYCSRCWGNVVGGI